MKPFSAPLLLPVFVFLLVAPPALADAESRARAAYDKKDYTAAAGAFKEAVGEDPDAFAPSYNLGVSEYRAGRYEEAKTAFQAAARTPDGRQRSRALFNLGNTHTALKDLKAAKQAWQDALGYDLENKAIRENLKWVEEELKKQQEQEKQADQQNQDQQNQDQQNQDQQNQEKQADQQNQDQQNQEKQANQQNKDQQNQDQQNQDQQNQDQQQQQAQQNQDQQQQQQQAQQDQQNQAQDEQKHQDGQAGQEPDQGNQGAGSSGQKPEERKLSRRELDKQEADKLLRSVEDKVSQYMFRPGNGRMEGRSRNGNDW